MEIDYSSQSYLNVECLLYVERADADYGQRHHGHEGAAGRSQRRAALGLLRSFEWDATHVSELASSAAHSCHATASCGLCCAELLAPHADERYGWRSLVPLAPEQLTLGHLSVRPCSSPSRHKCESVTWRARRRECSTALCAFVKACASIRAGKRVPGTPRHGKSTAFDPIRRGCPADKADKLTG